MHLALYIHRQNCLIVAFFTGMTVSGSALLVTHSSLERAVQQLVQQTASLEALLSALENEQLQTVQEG